jgi:hypothetical protein
MRNRNLQSGLHAVRAGALACLLLAIGAPARAQSQTPGFERRSDDPRTRTIAWLQSPDPRHQAWGAWYSGRDVQPEMIPLLQQVVSSRIASAAMADMAAADIALDALIQLNAAVPADLLLLVHERRPTQALVLLSKAGEDAADALLTLMRREKGLPWFAAANLALVRKPPQLGIALLEGMQLTATLVVSDTGTVGFGSGGGMGIGCGGTGVAEGLPPWPAYKLTPFAASGVVVLAPGPTPVYYQRTVAPAGSTPAGSTISRGGPSTSDRLKYLAAFAGVDASTLPLRGDEHEPHAWRGAAAIDAAVARMRADLRRRYALLLGTLVNARVLTGDDAGALPPPHVSIIILDGRQSREPPLSDLERD